MDPASINPYEAPESSGDSADAYRSASRNRRSGPAFYIALGAFAGGLAGTPLLSEYALLGYLTVIPGAIAGALVFRGRSRKWPVDPTVNRRRIGYAALVTVLIPSFMLLMIGLQGQGTAITLLGFIVGLALGLGILVSGDRRWPTRA